MKEKEGNVFKTCLFHLGLTASAQNYSIWEVEAGPGIQSYPWLHCKFKASLVSMRQVSKNYGSSSPPPSPS